MNSISGTHRRQRVGILFGGKSAEHDVSVQSARSILKALDKEKFDPVLIGIDRNGAWKLQDSVAFLAGTSTESATLAGVSTNELGLSLGSKHGWLTTPDRAPCRLDVIFPILHGPLGEDGALQGLLEMADIPYVGAGVLGSAVGMDKDVMKRLLHAAGVPVTEYIALRNEEGQTVDSKVVIETLGLPLFVKPANMGSSVGVSKVENEAELVRAIALGFRYDRKVLVEKAVDGDEVECALLGNEQPEVSVPGRIICKAEFYTYDAKYDEREATTLEIPAKLPKELREKVQEMAVKTYRVLECEGMARVDMFVTKQGDVFVNEINTLPGFTKFSMYPQLWEASGVSYTDLITELLGLAVERAERRRLYAVQGTAVVRGGFQEK